MTKLLPGSHTATTSSTTGDVVAIKNKEPIEISYSKFMDYCEKKHKNRNEQITNVQIETSSSSSNIGGTAGTIAAPSTGGSSNKITFEIVNSKEQQEEASSSSTTAVASEANARKFYAAMVGRTTKEFQLSSNTDDLLLDMDHDAIAMIGTKASSSTTRGANNGGQVTTTKQLAYTYTLEGTNTELIKFLRKNKIPFQAKSVSSGMTSAQAQAAASGSSSMSNIVFAGMMLYMYKNGGLPSSLSSLISSITKKGGKNGGGGSKNTIHNRSTTSFDDIEGIDDAKNDVLELVDTLRNPEKYSLVGARAPTGLLLEGPPGTGKVRVL